MRAALVATLLLAAAPFQSRAAPTANASAMQAQGRAEPHGSPWSFAILGDNRDDPDSVFPAFFSTTDTSMMMTPNGDIEIVAATSMSMPMPTSM